MDFVTVERHKPRSAGHGRRKNVLRLVLALFLAAIPLAFLGCSQGNPAAPSLLVKVYIYDSGSSLDDRFEVLVDAVSLGQTSTGGYRSFEGNLEKGNHTLRVVWTTGPDSVGTYGVYLTGGTFSNGATSSAGYIWSKNGYKDFEISVP